MNMIEVVFARSVPTLYAMKKINDHASAFHAMILIPICG